MGPKKNETPKSRAKQYLKKQHAMSKSNKQVYTQASQNEKEKGPIVLTHSKTCK
jgi:hypothetical protein